MTKKSFMRMMLVGEVMVFGWFYYFSSHGMCAVQILAEENECIVRRVQALESEIIELERTVALWQENHFLKEKIAREQLQLAKKDEIIYVMV